MQISVNGGAPISWRDFLTSNDVLISANEVVTSEDEARIVKSILESHGRYEFDNGGVKVVLEVVKA